MDIQDSTRLINILTNEVKFNIPLLIVMVVLVLLSAFFSMTETVFNSVNVVKLNVLADEGKKSAQKALWITNHYDRTLTTILVGNNIVNITLATISVTFFVELLGSNANLADLISTIVITIFVLIFGEIVPKTIGKALADSLAPKLSYVLYVVMIILFPIVIIFVGIQKLLHKKGDNTEPQVDEAQLEVILDTMEEDGAIESDEVELINNVLDLNDRIVKDIMTPRPDIVAISDDMEIDEIKDIFFDSHYSRIPVYHEDKDNIVGVLMERDFLTTYIKRKSFRIKTLLKKPKFVSATMKVDDLIHELQKDKMHMAMVSGEYGEIIGVVTMEDALEELIGEIYDEHDEETEEILIQKLRDNEYLLNGNVYLDDLFDDLDLGNPPETQYSKLSGFLFAQCEDVPEEGFNYVYFSKYVQKNDDEYEEVTKKLTFVVTKVEDRRIIKVKLFIEELNDEDKSENESIE